jgi:hypothetical protein
MQRRCETRAPIRHSLGRPCGAESDCAAKRFVEVPPANGMSHGGTLLFTDRAALPFVGALLPGLMIRAGRTVCAIFDGRADARWR